MRTRIFQIVQIAQKDDRASRLYDIFLVAVAFASIVPLMFHVDRLPGAWQFAFTALDFVTVYILFFDYLLRWITHDIKEGRRGDWKAFVKYPFTVTALIDLASILPSLGVLPASFMFLRALRVVRIMRYSRRLAVIVNTFASERRTLTLSLVLVGMYVFMVALLMFCNEPNTFDTFIDALYWAAVTLTTIGYGDLTPTTETGKVIVIAASIVGILVIALPAGIITGSFLDQLRQIGENRERYFEANSFARMHASSGFKATPASIRVYFQKNPRVGKYLVYMAAFTLLDCALYGAMSLLGFPVWLDTTGTCGIRARTCGGLHCWLRPQPHSGARQRKRRQFAVLWRMRRGGSYLRRFPARLASKARRVSCGDMRRARHRSSAVGDFARP